MIAQIAGKLVKLESDTALVQVGDLTYEVMLPGYCVNMLSGKIGTDIVLCTMEYFEGSPGGGNMIPRMVGFLSGDERDFFRKFIGVKGIGVKKGLKALSMPIATIASAIEDGDEKMLISLPAVGKRMAQQIIAELKGKLEAFAFAPGSTAREQTVYKPFQADALEILIAWGEKRNEALELIELACDRHPEIKTAEELVPIVYRLKQGVEV